MVYSEKMYKVLSQMQRLCVRLCWQPLDQVQTANANKSQWKS